jgi:hypothetical protein
MPARPSNIAAADTAQDPDAIMPNPLLDLALLGLRDEFGELVTILRPGPRPLPPATILTIIDDHNGVGPLAFDQIFIYRTLRITSTFCYIAAPRTSEDAGRILRILRGLITDDPILEVVHQLRDPTFPTVLILPDPPKPNLRLAWARIISRSGINVPDGWEPSILAADRQEDR